MIEPTVPTEHLEAAAVQLDDAHRESVKNLLAIAGPFAMAVLGLVAVRKQRREIRAELEQRALAGQYAPVDTPPAEGFRAPWDTDEMRAALEAIHAVMPEGVNVTVDSDGHVRLVTVPGLQEVGAVFDPVGVVNDPQRLTELVELARRFDGH